MHHRDMLVCTHIVDRVDFPLCSAERQIFVADPDSFPFSFRECGHLSHFDEGRFHVTYSIARVVSSVYPFSVRRTVPALSTGSCSKNMIHCSSTAVSSVFRFSSSVTSGRRSYAMIQGRCRWEARGIRSAQ